MIVLCFCCCSYSGLFLDELHFKKAIDGDAISPEFTFFIEWLTSELAIFTSIDEHVSSIAGKH